MVGVIRPNPTSGKIGLPVRIPQISASERKKRNAAEVSVAAFLLIQRTQHIYTQLCTRYTRRRRENTNLTSLSTGKAVKPVKGQFQLVPVWLLDGGGIILLSGQI